MAEIALALIVPGDSTTVIPSKLLFTRDLTPLIALRRGVDRWFLAAGALAILLTLILSFMLAARVTRPLAELTEKTSRVDLDQPDVTFDSGRSDEIGSLARVLDAMTARMQVGAQRLREAERRATTGDLARQINHDVKNGLAPIRHVLRHLAEVARNQPDELAHVFRDRQGTLESSVEYLENLSRNYARLTPAIDRGQADPNHLLREVARSLSIAPERVEVKLAPTLPPVRADAVALRRIIENLSGNAVDAVRDQGGTITLQSEVAGADGNVVVRLLVADTGPGMSRDQLERAFDDFFTTKDGGTGLGLSVVRRLVADLGGTLRVETEPGQGSRFIVDLPAAGPA
jgi:signal transduction histidine kinase